MLAVRSRRAMVPWMLGTFTWSKVCARLKIWAGSEDNVRFDDEIDAHASDRDEKNNQEAVRPSDRFDENRRVRSVEEGRQQIPHEEQRMQAKPDRIARDRHQTANNRSLETSTSEGILGGTWLLLSLVGSAKCHDLVCNLRSFSSMMPNCSL